MEIAKQISIDVLNLRDEYNKKLTKLVRALRDNQKNIDEKQMPEFFSLARKLIFYIHLLS